MILLSTSVVIVLLYLFCPFKTPRRIGNGGKMDDNMRSCQQGHPHNLAYLHC